MQNIQQSAATIIGRVMAGHNLNQELSAALQKNSTYSQQERGALQDICYGALRNYGQLVTIQNELVSKPIKDARTSNLIIVALYQLQYSKAAQYAVVDHAVRVAKLKNAAAGGLVNAVLRNFIRKQADLLQLATKSEVGRYSYPQWWIDAIKVQYKQKAPEILEAGNIHPPMTLRVNQRECTPIKYLDRLTAENFDAKLIEPNAILLKIPMMVDKLPGFSEGHVSVQDAGAQYAANLLDVHDGMKVLDACSAPGGKSAHLLETYNIKLVALDKDEKRLKRVQENLQRLKLNATLVCGDASNPEAWWDKKLFERILADVPCSASGVVRRHPDIKWLRRPSDIEEFGRQQEKILAALWPMLANGGKLLYATCSVFARENQQVIATFLSRHKDAKEVAISVSDMSNGQLLPNEQHDGFFYALLQKDA